MIKILDPYFIWILIIYGSEAYHFLEKFEKEQGIGF